MKPAPFDYVRPGNLADASALLLAKDGDAKLVAGGQSLGPMLNLRLVQPSVLIDIAKVVRDSAASDTFFPALVANSRVRSQRAVELVVRCGVFIGKN